MEYTLHTDAARHPSPLDASAPGDAPTPKSPDASPSPSVVLPRIDGLPAEILAHVMAGLITRTQAKEVAARTLDLQVAIAVHTPIHMRIGASLAPVTPFETAAALLAAHDAFKLQLRSLHIDIQHAFSNGRLTLHQALYAHRMSLRGKAIKQYAADGWESHTPDLNVWSAPFLPYVKPIPRRLQDRDPDDDNKFYGFC